MSNDGREELRSRVRKSETAPADASVVIRGGPDTPSLLRTHARRLHRLYLLDGAPIFGISVFVALDEFGPASERGILSGRLKTYPSIYRCAAENLLDLGFVLVPTFRRPHYTVVIPDLAATEGLAAALGSPQPNPYAESPKEDR